MNRELALCGFALLVLAFHLVQYAASRALDRQAPARIPLAPPLPQAVQPTNPGSGRHRRAGAPDAWIACHSLVCAHLQTPHTRTPAGFVCDECGNTPGGPMHDGHDDEADL